MPPRLTMHLRTRGQRSDATPTRRKVGGKQRNPRHSNPSLPSLWDGPLRSRAAPQPASAPPPRGAPHGSRSASHPRRHKAARLPKSRRKPQRAETHSLECWPALTESGKENPECHYLLCTTVYPAAHRSTNALPPCAHAAPCSRSASHPRRHKAAANRSTQERILSNVDPFSQRAGRKISATTNSPSLRCITGCRGQRSDAAPRREAGGKSDEKTPDSKSFHAAPKARPPSGQDGRHSNSHPGPPRPAAHTPPLLAQRLAPAPP